MKGIIFQYDRKVFHDQGLDALLEKGIHDHVVKTGEKPTFAYYNKGQGTPLREWENLDGVETKGVIWIFPNEVYVGVEK